MTPKPSFWARTKNFFFPPRETYESRQARGTDAVDRPGGQHYEAGDYRRAMDGNGS